jgi:DNA polymerase III alpha subunit (gram-positive type)
MVTHHELGEISHNREEESDERRVVETPPDLAETVRSLMEELQSCKDDNERLIKEQEKQTEINAVLLQILSDIQRQLQHGPTTSHVDRHHTKKTQSPPEIQKHGPESGHTRRSTSKKAQHGAKRHSTEESSSEETDNSKEFLVVKLVHIPRGEERRGNIPRAMTLKSLRNPNHPLSMEKLKRGKKQKFGYLA